MRKKRNLVLISLLLATVMVGCEEAANFTRGFIDGADAGSSGYSLIGSSSSSSSCSSACSSRGYKYYRYNSSTNLCYCK